MEMRPEFRRSGMLYTSRVSPRSCVARASSASALSLACSCIGLNLGSSSSMLDDAGAARMLFLKQRQLKDKIGLDVNRHVYTTACTSDRPPRMASRRPELVSQSAVGDVSRRS